MSFPRPPVNDVKLDTQNMHYVRDGGFEQSDIGARPVGLPKGITEGQRMTIKHTGGSKE